jgi:hypothetical protein
VTDDAVSLDDWAMIGNIGVHKAGGVLACSTYGDLLNTPQLQVTSTIVHNPMPVIGYKVHTILIATASQAQ